MDEFLRQQEILTPGDVRDHDVEIIGGGSLGGAILIGVVKMGFGIENRVSVVDFDRCELHNLPTQWFRRGHVALGQPKVDALAETVAWICDREITTFNDRFTGAEDRRLGPVVILAVDRLDERHRIWSNLRARDDVRFVIDARMGAEMLEIHAVDLERDDTAAYEKSLEGAEDALEEPCTRRAVVYTVLGGAAFVCSLLRAYVRGESFPRHVVFDFRHFLLEVGSPETADAEPERGAGTGRQVGPDLPE